MMLHQSSVAERVQPPIRQARCPRVGVGERRRQSSEDALRSVLIQARHPGAGTDRVALEQAAAQLVQRLQHTPHVEKIVSPFERYVTSPCLYWTRAILT